MLKLHFSSQFSRPVPGLKTRPTLSRALLEERARWEQIEWESLEESEEEKSVRMKTRLTIAVIEVSMMLWTANSRRDGR